MSRFADCTDCPGQIIVGKFSTISVPKLDEDGFPSVDRETGELLKIRLRLPQHRARLISYGPSMILGYVPGTHQPIYAGDAALPERPHSVFDPTGLVPSLCDHGLKEHPSGFRLYAGGRSWIRSKYMRFEFDCVVCGGAPVPDDLTTPRNAA